MVRRKLSQRYGSSSIPGLILVLHGWQEFSCQVYPIPHSIGVPVPSRNLSEHQTTFLRTSFWPVSRAMREE